MVSEWFRIAKSSAIAAVAGGKPFPQSGWTGDERPETIPSQTQAQAPLHSKRARLLIGGLVHLRAEPAAIDHPEFLQLLNDVPDDVRGEGEPDPILSQAIETTLACTRSPMSGSSSAAHRGLSSKHSAAATAAVARLAVGVMAQFIQPASVEEGGTGGRHMPKQLPREHTLDNFRLHKRFTYQPPRE